MSIVPPFSPQTGPGVARLVTAQLRLLGTTDIHANLLPYDYYADEDEQAYGLSRVATLIHTARGEVANCLLFDNGDALQGTPISDITAQEGSGWDGDHPMITAMNHLGYDALALGNHEFDFGLAWLENALKPARFPALCANLRLRTHPAAEGKAADDAEDRDRASGQQGWPLRTAFWAPQAILTRDILDSEGRSQTIRVGLLGLAPPQVLTWDKTHLEDRVLGEGMLDAARRMVPQLRAGGAEIVVLLAHTGLVSASSGTAAENTVLDLAQVPGVDAIFAGHVHGVFPSPAFADLPGIDARAGTVHGVPTVMPGFRGSHLGVIDLGLTLSDGRWQVSTHSAATRPVADSDTAPAPPDPGLDACLAPAHAHTVHSVRTPIGHLLGPVDTYLSLAGHHPGERLIAAAKRAELVRQLEGSEQGHLPVLVSVGAFKTGGRAGPGYYSELPAGPLALRHAADLYPFPNTLFARLITGAELRDWLERTAICFATLGLGGHDQPLLARGVPSHAFEIVDGLRYRIDPSQPPRFDMSGTLINPYARRIRDLTYRGEHVGDDARFVLGTTSFRISGSGPYPETPRGAILHSGTTPVRDILRDYISAQGTITPDHSPVWRFRSLPGIAAVFETGPGVRRAARAADLARFEDLGDGPGGFARLRLAL